MLTMLCFAVLCTAAPHSATSVLCNIMTMLYILLQCKLFPIEKNSLIAEYSEALALVQQRSFMQPTDEPRGLDDKNVIVGI